MKEPLTHRRWPGLSRGLDTKSRKWPISERRGIWSSGVWNEIMSLAAMEGRWSCWVKRTGECSLCGDGEARGHWAGMSLLVTGCSNPLLRCFFLTGPWEEEKGEGGWGTESLSEKKDIRAHREARLKLSQWEQSVPWRAESAWDFTKHDTHSAWESSACRGDLHVLKWWRGICNNTVKFALLVRLFGSTTDGCRSASWSLRGPNA